MTKLWNNLPNAVHIDKIIASVNYNRKAIWCYGSLQWTDAGHENWVSNQNTINSLGRIQVMHAAHGELSKIEHNDSWRAAIYAVTELIAEDNLKLLSPRVLSLIQSLGE